MKYSINSDRAIGWCAATALTLAFTATAFAGKGGKGDGGNGGGEPSLPQFMPPLVDYTVSWFSIPSGSGSLSLQDINQLGIAVGYHVFNDGFGENRYEGVVANADGAITGLDTIFGTALEGYASWESRVALEITGSGKVAMLLFHANPSDDKLVVVGDLETGELTVVDRIDDSFTFNIRDMNEAGDLIVELDGTEKNYWLYRSPYTAPPEMIGGPLSADSFDVKGMNDSGEILLNAYFTEIVQTKGRRTEERSTVRCYVREPGGALTDLGQSGGVGIATNGDVYGNFSEAPADVPSRWSPTTGWLPISPEIGGVEAVSKDDTGNVEVVVDAQDEMSHHVYREGYGSYLIEVTGGLNGQGDVDLWNGDFFSDSFDGISLPDPDVGAGYICGNRSNLSPGVSRAFILTPVQR